MSPVITPPTKYRITGTLSSPLPGAHFDELVMVAYQFIDLWNMYNFAKGPVNADGSFTLEFEAPAGPQEMAIMPVPAVLEAGWMGVYQIERTIPGLYFPHVHIAPANWQLVGSVYTYSTTLVISPDIWNRWAWLSEQFTVVGRVLKRTGTVFFPVPHAMVQALDVEFPSGAYTQGCGGAVTDRAGNFTIVFPRIAFFLNYAVYDPTLKRFGTEDWPNLIFAIVQKIGGIKTLIYEEKVPDVRPKSAWNVPYRILYVTLITDKGVANEEVLKPLPAGVDFLFHGIGLVQPHSLTDGYAFTGSTDDVKNLVKCPFGGTLHINGQFATAVPNPPKYYRILYAPWKGATPPDPSEFKPVLDESWTVSRYNPGTGNFEPLLIEPSGDIIPGMKLYRVPDYLDITITTKTRLIGWSTTREDQGIRRYPDGKYDLFIEAYNAAKTKVPLNTGDPGKNRLTVMVDNEPPKALLKMIGSHNILRTDQMMPYTPVCPVFSKALGNLPVQFDATDQKGHLLSYDLSFITGHNVYMDQVKCLISSISGSGEVFTKDEYHIGTLPSKTNLPPRQPGGFTNEVFSWKIGDPAVVKCAYQVRLGVWARTINGYGYIHYAEDTMHFSVE